MTALLVTASAALVPPQVLARRPASLKPDGYSSVSHALDEGEALSWLDAQRLELHVWRHPSDVYARVVFLGYSGRHLWDVILVPEDEYVENYVWLAKRYPRSWLAKNFTPLPTQQHTIIQMWATLVDANPRDAGYLRTAADQARYERPRLARKYLERAAALYPKDPDVLGDLASLYEGKWSELGLTAQQGHARALAAYRAALAATADPLDRSSLLADGGKVALSLADLAFAEESGKELLTIAATLEHRSAGDEIHHGHMLLGRVALRRRDIAGAKAHLMASAEIDGSPTLSSFGPNMALAKELLEAGESKVVLAYFDRLRRFWKAGCHGSLDSWGADVRGGRVPDFGANLRY